MERVKSAWVVMILAVFNIACGVLLMCYAVVLQLYLGIGDWGAIGYVVLHPWFGCDAVHIMFSAGAHPAAWMSDVGTHFLK